jgi:hypothetical protein
LVCSPLSLKILIGGESDQDEEEMVAGKKEDGSGTHDFLSSIEVLIIERVRHFIGFLFLIFLLS